MLKKVANILVKGVTAVTAVAIKVISKVTKKVMDIIKKDEVEAIVNDNEMDYYEKEEKLDEIEEYKEEKVGAISFVGGIIVAAFTFRFLLNLKFVATIIMVAFIADAAMLIYKLAKGIMSHIDNKLVF